MRKDDKEICMTCKHARGAGEVSRGQGLYLCPVMASAAREYAGSDAIMHVLVDGNAVGCMEDYKKDERIFESMWRYELEEERREEGKSLEEIYGLIPGVDFPETLSGHR